MNASTKSIIDLALSTSICACYAIPYVGGVLGALVAVGQFGFDWFNASAPPDPSTLPATQQELSDAIDAITAAITDAALAGYRADLTAQNDQFALRWADITMKDKGVSLAAWATFAATRKSECDTYFDMTKNAIATVTKLDAIRAWIEKMGDNNSAAGLYMVNGSLLINYHKNGLDWQNRKDLDANTQWHADFDSYNTDYAIWKLTRQGPAPTTVADPGTPLTAADLTPLNEHANALHTQVLPSLIKFASAVSTRWSTGWDSRQQQIDAAKAAFIASNPNLRQPALDLQWGQRLAYLWATLTASLGLEGIDTKDDVDNLKATIDNWKAVQKDLDQYMS